MVRWYDGRRWFDGEKRGSLAVFEKDERNFAMLLAKSETFVYYQSYRSSSTLFGAG